MAFSNAPSNCAVPKRCRRSAFDEPELDFLRTRMANEYVSSIESSLVRGSSLDVDLDRFDILVVILMLERRELKSKVVSSNNIECCDS